MSGLLGCPQLNPSLLNYGGLCIYGLEERFGLTRLESFKNENHEEPVFEDEEEKTENEFSHLISAPSGVDEAKEETPGQDGDTPIEVNSKEDKAEPRVS
ncbi:hypothetical protein Pfo_024544 [Paulownia fortunei]|nr:hypothetical protein Pfo_024544 [Paulownia fortunei]